MQRGARTTYSVLVIEDDPATLEFLQMLLHMSGYDVKIARNGSQGLVAAAARPFHAILTDWRLPDIDGLCVCQRLREEHGITTPLLIMTADRDADLEHAVAAFAATTLIFKPFEPSALLHCIAQMVG